jgi:hypothetical protein
MRVLVCAVYSVQYVRVKMMSKNVLLFAMKRFAAAGTEHRSRPYYR